MPRERSENHETKSGNYDYVAGRVRKSPFSLWHTHPYTHDWYLLWNRTTLVRIWHTFARIKSIYLNIFVCYVLDVDVNSGPLPSRARCRLLASTFLYVCLSMCVCVWCVRAKWPVANTHPTIYIVLTHEYRLWCMISSVVNFVKWEMNINSHWSNSHFDSPEHSRVWFDAKLNCYISHTHNTIILGPERRPGNFETINRNGFLSVCSTRRPDSDFTVSHNITRSRAHNLSWNFSVSLRIVFSCNFFFRFFFFASTHSFTLW